MKKQVSVVLAAAIAGGLLAGCGSTKPAETTAAAGTNGAGETQAEAAAGDVTIDVWHSMEGSMGKAFEAMVKKLQRDHQAKNWVSQQTACSREATQQAN